MVSLPKRVRDRATLRPVIKSIQPPGYAPVSRARANDLLRPIALGSAIVVPINVVYNGCNVVFRAGLAPARDKTHGILSAARLLITTPELRKI